jgi:RNA ligase
MTLTEYIDPFKLQEALSEGLVEKRRCPFAPLDLYVHTKKAVLETFWDETTTKCRGLIVHRITGEIVARPFEKFFNVDTSWRPETCISNLPMSKPFVAEKLDGSLGTVYHYDAPDGTRKWAVATKGSFMSEQAKWATQWYNDRFQNAVWPEGYTPVVEIIVESVQHHVVHYGGREELVLLALINNETGEEIAPTTLRSLGASNGMRVTDYYDRKTLGDVLNEDRRNAEGYVLTWPRRGQPPLKIKVKHPSFLQLQKIVHAATPKAILEALTMGNTELLHEWVGQTNDQLGAWVQGWIAKFNGRYANILLKCKMTTTIALRRSESRKEFAQYVHAQEHEMENVHASVCFAMLDNKDHKPLIWKFVEKAFDSELGKAFALLEE